MTPADRKLAIEHLIFECGGLLKGEQYFIHKDEIAQHIIGIVRSKFLISWTLNRGVLGVYVGCPCCDHDRFIPEGGCKACDGRGVVSLIRDVYLREKGEGITSSPVVEVLG